MRGVSKFVSLGSAPDEQVISRLWLNKPFKHGLIWDSVTTWLNTGLDWVSSQASLLCFAAKAPSTSSREISEKLIAFGTSSQKDVVSRSSCSLRREILTGVRSPTSADSWTSEKCHPLVNANRWTNIMTIINCDEWIGLITLPTGFFRLFLGYCMNRGRTVLADDEGACHTSDRQQPL